MNANHANELNHRIGHDLTLADAFDLDYLDEVEDVDERAAEQAINLWAFEFFYS